MRSELGTRQLASLIRRLWMQLITDVEGMLPTTEESSAGKSTSDAAKTFDRLVDLATSSSSNVRSFMVQGAVGIETGMVGIFKDRFSARLT